MRLVILYDKAVLIVKRSFKGKRRSAMAWKENNTLAYAAKTFSQKMCYESYYKLPGWTFKLQYYSLLQQRDAPLANIALRKNKVEKLLFIL